MLLRNCRHLKRGYTLSRPLILGYVYLLFKTIYLIKLFRNYSIPNDHFACALLVRYSSHERNRIDDTIRMLREDLETKQFEHQMVYILYSLLIG